MQMEQHRKSFLQVIDQFEYENDWHLHRQHKHIVELAQYQTNYSPNDIPFRIQIRPDHEPSGSFVSLRILRELSLFILIPSVDGQLCFAPISVGTLLHDHLCRSTRWHCWLSHFDRIKCEHSYSHCDWLNGFGMNSATDAFTLTASIRFNEQQQQQQRECEHRNSFFFGVAFDSSIWQKPKRVNVTRTELECRQPKPIHDVYGTSKHRM